MNPPGIHQSIYDQARELYGVSRLRCTLFILFPFLVTAVYSIALQIPASRDLTMTSMRENNPVELITFFTLFLAGMMCLSIAKNVWVTEQERYVLLFYLLFGFGSLFTAMEEISWGQWFFGFRTPESIARINAQGEFNFHNIHALQGHSEMFRIMFGLGGLIGIVLGFKNFLRKITPPLFLAPWFFVILLFALLDFCVERYSVDGPFGRLVLNLAELMELLIGIASYYFILLNKLALKSGKLAD